MIDIASMEVLQIVADRNAEGAEMPAVVKDYEVYQECGTS